MDLPNHLLPRNIQFGGGYAHLDRFLVTQPGVSARHVVDPEFWLHLAEKLRQHDRIEVVAADGSYDMDLRVVEIDPDTQKRWAKVRVLRFWSEERPLLLPVDSTIPAAKK